MYESTHLHTTVVNYRSYTLIQEPLLKLLCWPSLKDHEYLKNNPSFSSYIYQIFTVFLLWKIMQKHINIKDKWNAVPVLKEHRTQCNYSHLVRGIYSKYWEPSKSFCCVGFSYWYIVSGTKTEKISVKNTKSLGIIKTVLISHIPWKGLRKPSIQWFPDHILRATGLGGW